jgi:hypothetical protein
MAKRLVCVRALNSFEAPMPKKKCYNTFET